MTSAIARGIATANHHGQRTRSGELVLEHLARVAAAVGPESGAAAWLHDVMEHSAVRADELGAQGLTPVELEALRLLTRDPEESYELYALRIAHAPGDAGRLAREIKIADLADHLRRPALPADPPYAWARRHIAFAQDRRGELPVL